MNVGVGHSLCCTANSWLVCVVARAKGGSAQVHRFIVQDTKANKILPRPSAASVTQYRARWQEREEIVGGALLPADFDFPLPMVTSG